MKKNLFFVAAALAAMFGTTSCVNEVDMFKYNGTGTINLSVTNDNTLMTRADNITVPTTSTDWSVVATVNSEVKTAVTVNDFNTIATNNTFTNGTKVKLAVYNYLDDTAAEAAGTDNRGAARYAGESTEVTIAAGTNHPVNISCGKAKNGRLAVAWEESFTSLYPTYSLTVSSPRTVTFNSSLTSPAYFANGATVTYKLTYSKTGGSTIESSSQTVTIAEGTETKITVMANTNGKITLAISYDDVFATNTEADKTVTIDALTGEIVTP